MSEIFKEDIMREAERAQESAKVAKHINPFESTSNESMARKVRLSEDFQKWERDFNAKWGEN